MGFGWPVGDWLRGALRAWAEELLDEARLRREGFFTPRQFAKSGLSICQERAIGNITCGMC